MGFLGLKTALNLAKQLESIGLPSEDYIYPGGGRRKSKPLKKEQWKKQKKKKKIAAKSRSKNRR